MRIELEQLKKRERDLDEELLRVRAKVEAHKSRIEHLAWAKTPINTLPTEILSYVFELVTRMRDSYELHTLPLARVSRAWRDLIFNSAKFWSRIDLSPIRPDLNLSLVRARVARCIQGPLDIFIYRWTDDTARLFTLIDVIAPHAHRWRTLEVYANSPQCLQLILGKINHLRFPSLTRAYIRGSGIQEIHYPPFLSPDNAPSLKSLHLGNLLPMAEYPSDQRITNLSITFLDLRSLEPLTLPSLLSSQHLTTLVLAYSSSPSFQPDSISLPSLTSLTLESSQPRRLLSAIIPPKLSYFHFTVTVAGDPLPDSFRGLQVKFRNVRHLALNTTSSLDSDAECAEPIPSTFPNVRQFELRSFEADDYFRPGLNGSCPADHWDWLESLIFIELKIDASSIEHFIRWLNERKSKGLPMLRVKFICCIFLRDLGDDNEWDLSSPESLSHFHNVLREICTLDVVDVTIQATATVSLTSASPPPLVCIAIVVEEVILLISYDLEFVRSSRSLLHRLNVTHTAQYIARKCRSLSSNRTFTISANPPRLASRVSCLAAHVINDIIVCFFTLAPSVPCRSV